MLVTVLMASGFVVAGLANTASRVIYPPPGVFWDIVTGSANQTCDALITQTAANVSRAV